MATAEDRFTRLYEEHYGAVERYLLRRVDDAVVRDVVAEILLVVWRRLPDVPADALPWRYGTARRVLANELRSAARRTQLAARVADHVEPEVRDHDGEYRPLPPGVSVSRSRMDHAFVHKGQKVALNRRETPDQGHDDTCAA